MNPYVQLSQTFSQEISDFPIAFAFSTSQLEDAKQELGEGELVSVGNGGFMLKKNVSAFEQMMDRHQQQRKDFLNDDTNMIEALVYELGNHEYSYTYDYSDALMALGLRDTDERVKRNLQTAIKKYLDGVE